MKAAWATLSQRGSVWLARFAALAALLGLFVMSVSIIVPKPLAVIFAMSAGHVIGGVALLGYLAAVILEVRSHEKSKQKADRPANPPGEE